MNELKCKKCGRRNDRMFSLDQLYKVIHQTADTEKEKFEKEKSRCLKQKVKEIKNLPWHKRLLNKF